MLHRKWTFALLPLGLALAGLGLLFAHPTGAQLSTVAAGGSHILPLQGTATPTVTPACGVPPAWQPGPSVTPAAGFPPGVTAPDGYFYLGTGENSGGAFMRPLLRFDPATNSWTTLAQPLVATAGAAFGAPVSGFLFAAGGYINGNPAVTNTLQIYNIATDTWTTGAPLPVTPGREVPGAASYGGKLYVFGGDDGVFPYQGTTGTFIYDPATNTWTTGASLPAPRTWLEATTVGNRIYVYGGFAAWGSNADTLWGYDPMTDSWTTLAPSGHPQIAPGFSRYDAGRLLATGGYIYSGGLQPTTATYLYDIAIDSWLQGPAFPAPRAAPGQDRLPDGRVIVQGGWTTSAVLSSTLLLDPPPPCATATPTLSPPMPSPTRTLPPSPTNTPPPTATATACPIQFTDVDGSNPFYAYIRCLACRGIVSGYTTSPPCAIAPCFAPGANVTRSQTAKFVSNAANYQDVIPSTRQTFTDVPPSNAFWVYIERAYLHGVISGYTTNPPCSALGVPAFCPSNPVTRGQTAKFVANAANYGEPIPSTQQTFTDVPYSSAFWLYVERAYLHGVISGYTSGPPCTTGVPCFLAGNNVTRGQTAKFIANTFYPNCQTP